MESLKWRRKRGFQEGGITYAETRCVKGQERDDKFCLAVIWAGSWHKKSKS
jgi:hypothetical protein